MAYDRVVTTFSPPNPRLKPSFTDLAVHGNVAAATQNLAMNALVFLHNRVLRQALPGSINAVRRQEDQRPVVMTREEVATVTSPLYGTAPLVA
jgi:hypothetical protein